MNNSEKMISWLKYLDVEYLDDSTCEALAKLNINDVTDHDEIINLAMHDEVGSLNEISRMSMMRILDEISTYPESAVRKLIARIGMPFDEPLLDYEAFFSRVRQQLFSK